MPSGICFLMYVRTRAVDVMYFHAIYPVILTTRDFTCG